MQNLWKRGFSTPSCWDDIGLPLRFALHFIVLWYSTALFTFTLKMNPSPQSPSSPHPQLEHRCANPCLTLTAQTPVEWSGRQRKSHQNHLLFHYRKEWIEILVYLFSLPAAVLALCLLKPGLWTHAHVAFHGLAVAIVQLRGTACSVEHKYMMLTTPTLVLIAQSPKGTKQNSVLN